MKKTALMICALGLALAGCGGDDPVSPNRAPVITAGPSAVPTTIYDTQTTILSVTATDADGDNLTYSWTVAEGTINGTGSLVVYDPAAVVAQEVHTVTVVVSDGKGESAMATIDVTVNPGTAIGARYRVRLDSLRFANTDCDGVLDSTIEAFWNIQAVSPAVASIRPENNPFNANTGNVLAITTGWAEANVLFSGSGAITVSGTLSDYDSTSANDLIGAWNLSYNTNNISVGSFSISGGNPGGEGCLVFLNFTIEKMNDVYPN